MPVWCPQCNAMLPEGLEECPRCGTSLGTADQPNFSRADFFSYSLYAIGIALIPVVIAVIIGIICIKFGG
jgi:rRNA maturation protein Nop10